MKKRGGRAALDRLQADLAAIRASALELREHPRGLHAIGREATDILHHPTNIRLVEDAAEKITQAVPAVLSQIGSTTQAIMALAEELQAFISADLEPMLERSDSAKPVKDPDVYRRLAALEARISQLDQVQQGIVPLPDRQRERR